MLYEYLERQRTATFFGTRYRREERRFSLCTGEAVEPVDFSTFKLVGKNEQLTRIAL